MHASLILGIVAVTSIAAWGVLLGRRTRGFAAGISRVLEVLGLSVIFFIANVLLGLAAILAVRLATPAFLSVYLLNDTTLIAMSVLQGLLFHAWRSSAHQRP